MKLPIRVSMAFKVLNAVEKVSFGSGVVNCLTPAVVTANFPNLPVPVTNLEEINDLLDAAVTAVQATGSKQSRTTLKNTVKQWTEAFAVTASYVNMVAFGNAETIILAGFEATKEFSQPTQKPVAPAGFTATINGTKGAILAETQTPVPEATAYVFYAYPDGVTVSFSENTMIITVEGKTVYINAATKKKTAMYNLPSIAAFNVGMYAINRAGVGPASGVQQVITQ